MRRLLGRTRPGVAALAMLLASTPAFLLLSEEERIGPPPDLGDLRIAPSPIPPGTSEVVIGSARGLPEAVALAALSGGVVVQKVDRLSGSAIRAVVATEEGTREARLGLTSAAESVEAAIPVASPPGPLAVPANLPEEALRTGEVETPRDVFVYAFLPAEGVDLAGVCILNETTGAWHQRDIEPPEAEEEEGAPEDVSEAEEAPRPDFLGVRLALGPNRLLIATFARDGTARLEELRVTRTGTAEDGP